jgi:antitoxin CcdA
MSGSSTNAVRQPANLSIDAELMKEARGLGVNISRAAEAGIAEAVAVEKARLWKIENRAAIESWNAYVEEYGIPLEEFRQF